MQIVASDRSVSIISWTCWKSSKKFILSWTRLHIQICKVVDGSFMRLLILCPPWLHQRSIHVWNGKRVARAFSQKMPVELPILLDRGNGNRQTGDSCLGVVFFGRFPCTQESGKARTASWIEPSWNVYKHTHKTSARKFVEYQQLISEWAVALR